MAHVVFKVNVKLRVWVEELCSRAMQVRTPTGDAAEPFSGSIASTIGTAAHALVSDGVLHGGTNVNGQGSGCSIRSWSASELAQRLITRICCAHTVLARCPVQVSVLVSGCHDARAVNARGRTLGQCCQSGVHQEATFVRRAAVARARLRPVRRTCTRPQWAHA